MYAGVLARLEIRECGAELDLVSGIKMNINTNKWEIVTDAFRSREALASTLNPTRPELSIPNMCGGYLSYFICI